jgi:Domain of unknown function (DUF4062)
MYMRVQLVGRTRSRPAAPPATARERLLPKAGAHRRRSGAGVGSCRSSRRPSRYGYSAALQRREGAAADEMEPAPGRRPPRHLESQRAAADARRHGPGDQRRENVRALVRPPSQHQARRPRRHLRRSRLRRGGAADRRARHDHLRVFVSSTLGELADERRAVSRAISALRLAPVMFEAGARPHPPRDLYQAYLAQSDVFIGLYWQRYGWIGPGMEISGLEEEFELSRSLPRQRAWSSATPPVSLGARPIRPAERLRAGGVGGARPSGPDEVGVPPAVRSGSPAADGPVAQPCPSASQYR